MTAADAVVIIAALATSQVPELARTWAADRRDKRRIEAKKP